MTKKNLKQLRTAPVGETGNRLELAFELDGRQQTECARQTGLSPQYVADVKAGRYQNLRRDNLQKFATFFGCAIEDLFPARHKAVA